MKASRINLNAVLFTFLVIFAVAFSACSEDSIISGPGFGDNTSGSFMDNNTRNISIQVVKGTHSGYYFKITNNTRDTVVNDFHIQMVDTTVLITGFSTWPSNWVMDENTTDKTKGKVGIETGQNGQGTQPGQTGRPLWIDVKFGRSKNRAFNWQATQNGVTVASGVDSLPR
ncbi:MAG: hypothetical protein L0Y79_07145 [Chlorobi bacterium]|nr:hypothetical protein [Chlorobiota bacterium]MCI0715244.1 hypothetical protein [Chlorobiota bacterium]